MVGIVVISHGGLCEGIADSASMIIGESEQMETVSLRPGMSPDDYRAQLRKTVKRLDTGKGVLVLADLIGGTPFNSIALLMQELNTVVVTGVNLPMLINVATERTEDSTLEELAALAEETALESVKILKR